MFSNSGYLYHHSFSRSKYFHLLITPIEGFILWLDNERDRKIDVTAILFLLVQNRHQTHGWTLIGSGVNGLGIQKSICGLLRICGTGEIKCSCQNPAPFSINFFHLLLRIGHERSLEIMTTIPLIKLKLKLRKNYKFGKPW